MLRRSENEDFLTFALFIYFKYLIIVFFLFLSSLINYWKHIYIEKDHFINLFYTRSSHRLISFFWGIFSLSFSAQSFKSGERVFVRFFKNTVQHNLIVSFFCHRLDQRVWRVFFFLLRVNAIVELIESYGIFLRFASPVISYKWLRTIIK